MMDAPSAVTAHQLEELHIALAVEEDAENV